MFVFDEGSIEIPKQWKDETINVLSSSSDGAAGFTLVINRAMNAVGYDFSRVC